MQASLRETSVGATRTWSPELDISRVYDVAQAIWASDSEPHIRLLADPKGEQRSCEEFRTPPKLFIIFSFLS